MSRNEFRSLGCCRSDPNGIRLSFGIGSKYPESESCFGRKIGNLKRYGAAVTGLALTGITVLGVVTWISILQSRYGRHILNQSRGRQVIDFTNVDSLWMHEYPRLTLPFDRKQVS